MNKAAQLKHYRCQLHLELCLDAIEEVCNDFKNGDSKHAVIKLQAVLDLFERTQKNTQQYQPSSTN